MKRRGSQSPWASNNLNDLDRELELLRRKRELLQQQQHAVMNTGYGDVSQLSSLLSFGQQIQTNSNHNFGYMYEDRHGSRSYNNPKPFNRKRTNDYHPPGIPAKRFAGPKGNRDFSRGPGPKPGPGPKHGYGPRPGAGPRPRPGPKPTSGFKPSSSSKFSPGPTPSINSHKSEALNVKPSKPDPFQSDKPKFDSKVKREIETDPLKNPTQVLRSGKSPTQAMWSRLESAMGHILKDLREKFEETDEYRKRFASDNFLYNLKQIIRERLRKVMTGKVIGNMRYIMATYRAQYPESDDISILEDANKPYGPSIKLIEADDPAEFFKLNLEALLSTRLSIMLREFKQYYANNRDKIEDLIKEEVASQIQSESENNKEVKENGEGKGDATKKVEISVDVEKANGADLKQDKQTANEAVDVKKESIDETKVQESFKEDLNNKEKYCMLLDELLQDRLPVILPKFKHLILATLKCEPSFMRGLQKIKFKTNYNASVQNANMHCLKLIGVPILPDKEKMQPFLSQFPLIRSIKKFKVLKNVLIVKTDDDKTLEALLAAKNTVIDDKTIQIIQVKKEGSSNHGEKDENNTSDNKSFDNLGISSDIDEQISDLLTSIKNSEDEVTKEKEQVEDAQLDDGANGNDNQIETTNDDVVEITDEQPENEKQKPEAVIDIDADENDVQEAQKPNVSPTKGTPAAKRASARLAAPSVTTRRSSKLN